MNLPVTKDIKMVRGDTYIFGFTVSGFDEIGAIDTVTMSCRLTPDSPSYIFQRTLGNGVEEVETGVYRVTVAAVDTDFLDYKKSYVYDVEIRIGEFVRTIIKGKLTLEYDVTR